MLIELFCYDKEHKSQRFTTKKRDLREVQSKQL